MCASCLLEYLARVFQSRTKMSVVEVKIYPPSR
ncbi:hypothetical protein COLO4_32700 [Corchorus olitorius]|uniref:Uncharacterized protein n=1 Tax=Corchorus olitorius TaxID=93759 RepID=A0A1R3GYF4_9ROSI|nr:hypothetical protein COLO4_32700 [Corchorus olitorius]